jgi:hypothetical protein
MALEVVVGASLIGAKEDRGILNWILRSKQANMLRGVIEHISNYNLEKFEKGTTWS